VTTPIKADRIAADRVLTAAVREARAQMRGTTTILATHNGETWWWRNYDRGAIVEMLEHAGYAAALLVDRP
jgi:hypothetical protein